MDALRTMAPLIPPGATIGSRSGGAAIERWENRASGSKLTIPSESRRVPDDNDNERPDNCTN